MTRWTHAFLAALVLLTPAAAQEQDPAIALTGATIHPVNGPTLTDATLVIRNGRIEAVGQGVAVPEGAKRVDLKGKHLYPGLIDANSVLGLVEVSSVKGTIDDSEVGTLNPNLRAEVAVNPDSELLAVARTGGVLLALTRANSGLISGTSALIRTDGWTYEDMTVKAPVFLHVRWPGMRIDRSGLNAKSPKEQVEAREGVLRKLEDTFRTARAYGQAQAGKKGTEADVKWEAMQRVLSGEIPVAIQADDRAQIEAALDWASREGLRVVLVGGADAWRVAPRLKAERVPVILGPIYGMPRRSYEAVHTPFENAAKLHAAGVSLAFSNGASSFAAANARNLRDDAAMAIAHGLPEEAALHALTLGAARILGVDGKLGSIERGKQATLFATDAPLFDFRSRVTHAWITGRAASLNDRQRRLYERYKDRPPR